MSVEQEYTRLASKLDAGASIDDLLDVRFCLMKMRDTSEYALASWAQMRIAALDKVIKAFDRLDTMNTKYEQ